MSEETVCRTCQQNEFIVENYERICISCGEVQDELIDEGRLCMVPDHQTFEDNLRSKKHDSHSRLTSRIRGEANDAQTRKRIHRDKVLDESRRMVKQLIKHPDAIAETMELLATCLNEYKGRMMHSKRESLIGACVYYLSSKHQLGITVADICKAWGIKLKFISASMKQVKQLCPDFEYERPNMKDLVNKFVDQLAHKYYPPKWVKPSEKSQCHDTKDFPLIEVTDKPVLINRVMLLLDLYEAMHPFNQPAPQSLITAVVYHAWKSLDTFKLIAVNLSTNMRKLSSALSGQDIISDDTSQQDSNVEVKAKHRISYDKFCQICEINCSKNGYNVVRKLQTSLLLLGKCFGDVNKSNLAWYLKDIIDNSALLVKNHLKKDSTLLQVETLSHRSNTSK